MATKKRTAKKPDPAPAAAESAALPAALQLDDAPPTAVPAVEPPAAEPAASEEAGFRRHVAEQGQAVLAETTGRTVAWQDPREGPAVAPAVIAVEVPMADEITGYTPRHVEARLTVDQATALQRLRVALAAAGARTQTAASGSARPVQSAADAVRWLLDRLGEAK